MTQQQNKSWWLDNKWEKWGQQYCKNIIKGDYGSKLQSGGLKVSCFIQI